MAVDAIQERLKLVRAATQKTQTEFARQLDEAAQRLLGAGATRYDQPLVSVLENGGRDVTLDDVAVYAAVDPERRGKLWLGWAETADSAMGRGERSAPRSAYTKEPRPKVAAARKAAS